MADIFHATTIPVLEQVVNFTQARHTVLAGNIANLDTPGYVARDLSVDNFQAELKRAIQEQHAPEGQSSGALGVSRSSSLAQVSKSPQSIMLHDQSNVGSEHQVSEMVKNRLQHNLAITILSQQFRLLQAAISEHA